MECIVAWKLLENVEKKAVISSSTQEKIITLKDLKEIVYAMQNEDDNGYKAWEEMLDDNDEAGAKYGV